jgi:FkbM family methyltransferase
MPSPTEYLRDLQALPANARIVIYGTGGLAHALYRRLSSERPDVVIVAFLDSYREGTCLGRPVCKPATFFAAPPAVDLYIIASHLWAREIDAVLESYHAAPRIVSLIVAPAHYAYLHLAEGRYLTEEVAVERILYDEHDRTLWRTVMHCARTHDPTAMAQWYLEHPGTPYLYRVRLGEGAVVIEGGVFDGSNSVEFASRIGASGKVYGFDPVGETFMKSRRGGDMERFGNIEIIKKALWDRPGELNLSHSGPGTRVAEGTAGAENRIEAVSIDHFAQERRLKRLDLIKMDIEGAEQRALKGGMESIRRFRPQLAICIYHSQDDLFNIPQQLATTLPRYRFHLHSYSPSLGDLVLYGIPEEMMNGSKTNDEYGMMSDECGKSKTSSITTRSLRSLEGTEDTEEDLNRKDLNN